MGATPTVERVVLVFACDDRTTAELFILFTLWTGQTAVGDLLMIYVS